MTTVRWIVLHQKKILYKLLISGGWLNTQNDEDFVFKRNKYNEQLSSDITTET